jgi:hypothetical protein
MGWFTVAFGKLSSQRRLALRRVSAPVLVLMLCCLSVSACSGLPGKELETLGSEVIPQTVNFAELAVDAKRARAAYLSEAGIRAAYPNTVHVASPGGVGVQYFIERDDKARTQIVTVRGTDGKVNLKEDFDVKIREDRRIKIPVHEGFDADARAIYADAAPLLKKGYSTYLVGHSLGGAIASIVGLYAIEDGHAVKKITTFGEPRFTTAQGASQLSFLPLLRVVDEYDIVPLLPTADNGKFGDYEQVGPEVILLEGPYYVYLSAPVAREVSVGEFWRDMKLANLQDHKMAAYEARIAAKLKGSKQVPYDARKRYAALHKTVQSLKQK